jgi:hypothetical protein
MTATVLATSCALELPLLRGCVLCLVGCNTRPWQCGLLCVVATWRCLVSM